MNKRGRAQPELSLAKFVQLRPPYCVTVNRQGSHSVCVCTKNQNPKLMLDALGGTCSFDLSVLMAKVVCAPQTNGVCCIGVRSVQVNPI